jgi:hypothetical protein
MKFILGATIALLALVSVGLAVYAYTEHREVAYLILRADALEARINELDGHTPRIAQLEQQVNSAEASRQVATPEERAVPEPTPGPPEVTTWGATTPEERHAIREAILGHRQQKFAPYTDQQLYETRAEGPTRPGCEALRQRAARNVPTWMELNFIGAFGCLTPTEERLRKLENQSLYPPPVALEPYEYPAEQGLHP